MLQFFIINVCNDLFFIIPWEIFSAIFLSKLNPKRDKFNILFEENKFFPIVINTLLVANNFSFSIFFLSFSLW